MWRETTWIRIDQKQRSLRLEKHNLFQDPICQLREIQATWLVA